jgi:hypothetical protein
MSKPEVKQYLVNLCDGCIDAKGQECHTPGCAMFLHSVDIPFHREVLLDPVKHRWWHFSDMELNRLLVRLNKGFSDSISENMLKEICRVMDEREAADSPNIP